MSDKQIWDYLMKKIGNAYGVAGLMGNLYVESHLNPVALQSSCARKLNMTSEEYTQKVDDGSYQNFVKDSAGYGLAQWSYWSRKEALYKFSKEQNKSIGSLELQLDYLWQELLSYKTVLNTLKSADSVRQASDIVVERYEKPKNQSETFKQTRAEFGQKFFNAYANGKPEGKQVVTTCDKVNIRTGNGKNYSKAGQTSKGSSFPWVATADNNWHAIVYKDQVAWISGEFCKIE